MAVMTFSFPPVAAGRCGRDSNGEVGGAHGDGPRASVECHWQRVLVLGVAGPQDGVGSGHVSSPPRPPSLHRAAETGVRGDAEYAEEAGEVETQGTLNMHLGLK